MNNARAPFCITAILALAGLVSACGGHACGLVNCSSGATIVLPLATPPTSAFPLTVKACRGLDCRTAHVPATLETQDLPPLQATPGAPTAAATIARDAGGALTLRLSWDVPDASVANGDRYTVNVSDAAGGAIASFDRAATYKKVQPNGEDCQPVCEEATFE
jgi:hypothetical protein